MCTEFVAMSDIQLDSSKLLIVDPPCKLRRHQEAALVIDVKTSSTYALKSDGSAKAGLIDFQCTHSIRKRHTRV